MNVRVRLGAGFSQRVRIQLAANFHGMPQLSGSGDDRLHRFGGDTRFHEHGLDLVLNQEIPKLCDVL
ncbi:hypothetical protein D3C73_1668310 [compost metagenome]